jgi:quinol monooxygenase YgiN
MLILLVLGGIMNIASAKREKSSVWKGHAVLVIKEDKVNDFIKAVSKIIQPTLKERGCISYEGYRVLDEHGIETNRFEFHEVWASKEAMMIDHKENSSHMKAFFKEIKADTEGTFIESFEVGGNYVNKLI